MVGMILLLTWGALQSQMILAGFLNSESIWSKAQKQAVIDLEAYAGTGEPALLADFRNNYGLLDSDRWARDALARGNVPDIEISEAFVRGNVMPAAKPGMIFMLRHFTSMPYLRQALDLWRSTDDLLAELNAIAAQIEHDYATGGPSTAEIARQRKRIQQINDTIQPRSNQFSLEIAHGAVWLGRVLFAAVFIVALLASLLWLSVARRILAGIRDTEERYRQLFDSAADAIVIVDDDNGRMLHANRKATEWTGRSEAELAGKRFASLFAGGTAPSSDSDGQGLLRNAQGGSRPVEMQTSVADWGDLAVRQAIIRDVSERVANEQERRVAAEALGSIADGVIIADADRRVLSVNAAHIDITGFNAEMLSRTRFDDLRRMPDGTHLPASVWDTVAAGRQWHGEVQSRHRDGSVYPEMLSIGAIRSRDGRVLHYVATFSNIAEAKAQHQRLEHLAAHDALTGLVNRTEFEHLCAEAIAAAQRDHGVTAVLFIDLDAFKIVNDRYSHAVGDRLLKKIAERIRRQLSDGDVAGRIGGDEFTVLVRRLALREDAVILAQRLLSVLSTPVVLDDYEITLSASIGIAGYPLDGGDAATLIANADAAMYVAKSEERNAYRFYTPLMQARTRRRLLLASDLRQALAGDEFRLMYQPSIELKTGRVVAVEALLRWEHPDRGEIMPGEFIPVAESLGLIRRIDEWVMRAACNQIKAWDALGVPPIRVAVNVSASWFSHRAFIEGVRRNVQSLGIAPQRLLLEITEGTILHLGEDTEQTMHALHGLGVGVAIDDFGTGYSSLAYLKLPAVEYLKIDQSFVAGLPESAKDVAITEAVLAVSRSLGLCSIAEGIETEAQHEFLLRAGCVEGQGYLYSYPVSAAAIEHMLRPRPDRARARLELVPPKRH
jgi:diguanylate cyclase (GGDEF)-like protein/PAS domain S-box-containing protein